MQNNYLPKTKSVKTNAILNIIKQSCNVFIPLITYPYVSRTLGAENFGKYSFSSSFTGIIMVFATLGIETYAVREGSRIRDDKKAISKFSSEIYSINLIAMLLSVAAMIMLVCCVPRFNKNSILTYILSINIITFVTGRDWINSIYEDYFYITIRYILFQLISLILIFTLVHNSDDYILYTCITVVANSGGYIANFFYTKRYVPLKITTKLNLKKHLRPIIYLFGVALAIQIYIQSDVTILGFFRSDKEVGIYSLASKVYTIIKGLLNAVIMVVLPRLSNYLGRNDEKSYNNLLMKLKNALYAFVFPCVVGLFFESKNVMRLIGGNEFTAGSTTLKLLCIALIFAVFGCYYAQGVLVPNRREKYFLIATIIAAVENIALNIIIIPYLGMEGAAITTVLAEMIVMLYSLYHSRDIINRDSKKDIISVIIGCLVIGAICLFVEMRSINYIVKLILSIGLSVIIYASILILLKNQIMLESLQFLLKRIKRS